MHSESEGPGRADELSYRLRQQRLLVAFARMALQASTHEELLDEASALAAQGLEASYGKVLEYRPESGDLLLRAGVGWAREEIGAVVLQIDPASPAGYAFQHGTPVLSNHLSSESRFRTPDLLVRYRIRRALNVLIERGGEEQDRYGVLEVDSPDPGSFDAADAEFLAGCAGILGVAIERLRSEDRLREALERQAFVTREMSHRVKNSLGIVASLLRVNAKTTRDPGAQAALEDAEARVMTIAKVHDHLWRGGTVGVVALPAFLGDLCRNLAESAGGIVIESAIEPLSVGADQAIPIGLIVNELVTNALKYAYSDGCGTVNVALARKEGELVLEVRDAGAGLPEDFDLAAPRPSFGMRIILNLARQLDATLEAERLAQGTLFRCRMPLSILENSPPPPAG
ncbi:sensor histidine kinase [Aureimonas populi]|uniref:histidine kinase n=1 Tax=Aureimonas populi TaxID=1701758 RepID=A0ABW5CSD7_9HYPH|nr:histidine kinase dimerization/phosphoacceptor domain -containing protein [Aureimonas populi]